MSRPVNSTKLRCVLSLRESGLTQAMIAKSLELSSSTVQYWCKTHVPGMEEERREEKRRAISLQRTTVLQKFRNDGASPSEIATSENLSESHVRRIIDSALTQSEKASIRNKINSKKLGRKIEVLEYWLASGSMDRVSAETGVPKSTLSTWIKQDWIPTGLRCRIEQHLQAVREKQMKLRTMPPQITGSEGSFRLHTQIQAKLAFIGTTMGCQIWIPKNDQGAVRKLLPSANFLNQFPCTELCQSVVDIIDKIDVIWFRGRMISRCFEIEVSTGVGGGICRIHELLEHFPNLRITGHIVTEKKRSYLREVSKAVHSKVAGHLSLISFDTVMDLADNPFLPHLKETILDSLAVLAGGDKDVHYSLPGL